MLKIQPASRILLGMSRITLGVLRAMELYQRRQFLIQTILHKRWNLQSLAQTANELWPDRAVVYSCN
jgi:hypothetical protein